MENSLTQQIDTLEMEADKIKSELLLMQATKGDSPEYRALKNKWYENQQEIFQCKIANRSHTEVELHNEEVTPANTDANNTTKNTGNIEEASMFTNIAEAEIQSLKVQNSLLTNNLETLKSAYNALKKQHCKEENTDTEEANISMEEQSSSISKEADTTAKELQEKICDLEGLPQVLIEKNLLVEFLQNQLDKQVKHCAQLEKEHSLLKAELSQANETSRQKQESAEQMLLDLQKKDQYIAYIKMQYRKAQHSNEIYKKQLDEAFENLSSLRAHVSEALQQSRN